MKRACLWIVAVVLAASVPNPGSAPTPGAVPAERPLPEVADFRTPEVRLRKLYMVRPDLLQYPVPYDVVC